MITRLSECEVINGKHFWSGTYNDRDEEVKGGQI